MNKHYYLLLLVGLIVTSTNSLAKETLFANGNLAKWEEQFFDAIPNHTKYQIIEDPTNPTGHNLVLDAVANNAGSGYVLKKSLPFTKDASIDLSYQVVSASNTADEKTKAGDDFPLRIYLTSKSFLFYTTLVLVHSSQYPSNTNWLSPYSGNVANFHMYVISGNEKEIGNWESINIPVGKIWQEVFGEIPDELVGFSMMVDSDNAKGQMHTKIAKIDYSW